MTYDERLENLLSEAAKTFADNGFHSTSMRDLSRITGLSLAGIYHYVKSKDELLFHIQQRCFTEVLAGAREAVSEAPDAEQALRAFIQHHVTFFAGHMAEMKVLSHEADSLAGDQLASVNELKRQYVELLLELLRRGTSDPGRDAPDPRVATYALFGMLNWIYTWYDPAGPVSPDRLADHFAAIYLHGVVATPSAART